jgi:hypothetical protein
MTALTTFLHEQLDYIRDIRGLGVAVKAVLASDSEVLSYCRASLYDAFGAILTRAQDDGSVRTDIEPPQLLRLVHGVALASDLAPQEAHQLLGIVIDGLRARS